ncbi:glycolipid 2-alpha-mannosyltransferase-domain-containing protein [Lactarius indigo]|nr:glycolipid 2-alpha-mannosyltransferase-domain-containing protein [Lactarius indigo]
MTATSLRRSKSNNRHSYLLWVNLFLAAFRRGPPLPVMSLSVIRRNILLSIVIVAVLSLACCLLFPNRPLTRTYVMQTLLYTLTSPLGHLRLLPLTSPTDATLLVVCEDSDLGAVLTTMQQIEDRFNAQARYPWTFLCDEPLTEDFKTRVSTMTDSPISFDVIPTEHWGPPDWINRTRAEQVRKNMGLLRIPQGDSARFRNLSRFNAGFLARQDILQPYRYYWRIQPGSQYFCDFFEDPFEIMREGKIYAFNMALREMEQTVSTLWEAVYDFMQEHKLRINTGSNLAGFVTEDEDTYTLCHYESSFEVIDMKFLRSAGYLTFFDYLDKKAILPR